MRLLLLKLTHFKGIKELEVNPGGDDLAIYGDNATGKTTVADAYLWLLFDKDSEGKKDFDIKTLAPDGKPVHNLEHRVVGSWILESGAKLELEKVYKEKWVKSRGKSKAEFEGHTTDYRINGVPVPKKDYDAKVASIYDEQRFRLLSDPTYFCTGLKWQDRRRILLDLIGDITDAQVINSDPSLSKLPNILGTHSLDDYRRMIAASRKKTADQLEQIPIRIDELTKSIPSASNVPSDASARKSALESQLTELSERRASIAAGAEVSELRAAIAQAEAEREKIRIELRQEQDAGRNAQQSVVTALARKIADLDADLARLETHLRLDRQALDGIDGDLARLRNQYSDINAEVFVFTGVDSCAACGQALPADRVEEARQKALEAFNLAKSQKLEENRAAGRNKKAQAEMIVAKVAEKESQIEDLKKAIVEHTADRVEAQAALNALGPASDISSDPRLVIKEDEITLLGDRLVKARAGHSDAIAAIDEQLATIRGEIQAIHAAEAAANEHQRALDRISELEGDEKRLAAEIERMDHELHLCEEFIRAKVRLLEERVNSQFELVNFRLFEDQINGGLQETCKATVNGVPYESLNHGSRMNAGLDIINTLARAYEFAPPVILDNAESVTKFLPTKGQKIRLIVSEADTTLRVEQEPARELALA